MGWGYCGDLAQMLTGQGSQCEKCGGACLASPSPRSSIEDCRWLSKPATGVYTGWLGLCGLCNLLCQDIWAAAYGILACAKNGCTGRLVHLESALIFEVVLAILDISTVYRH